MFTEPLIFAMVLAFFRWRARGKHTPTMTPTLVFYNGSGTFSLMGWVAEGTPFSQNPLFLQCFWHFFAGGQEGHTHPL